VKGRQAIEAAEQAISMTSRTDGLRWWWEGSAACGTLAEPTSLLDSRTLVVHLGDDSAGGRAGHDSDSRRLS
jgi:hypothetical protein